MKQSFLAKKNLLCALALCALQLGLMTACGTGQDPLGRALGDPTTLPVGTMSLPLASTVASVQLQTPYTASSPYFGLYSPSVSTTTPIYAPTAGLVTQADASGITILSSSRVSVQLTGVSPSGIVAGNYVNQDAQVGFAVQQSFGAITAIRFAIIVDGKNVCPLSFLSSTTLSRFYSFTGASSPCQ